MKVKSLILMTVFMVTGMIMATEKVGIHYMSEYNNRINKHCGWKANSDSNCYAWKPPGKNYESAVPEAEKKDVIEGKISYRFVMKHGWSRWVLVMKKGKSVDYSPFDRLVFYIQSLDAKYWDTFKVIVGSKGKEYSKELKDLEFKTDGNWYKIEIPIKDIAAAGVDTGKITSLIQFAWGGGVSKGHVFYLDDLHLEKGESVGPKMIESKRPAPKPVDMSANPFEDMSGYKLVWSDEFDKNGAPNPDKWTFEEGFKRNKEVQWYQKENAYCKDGKLIFEARREKKPNPNFKAGSNKWQTNRKFIEYTSSSIITKKKHSWKYGRFEIRAKIDTRMGMWPAIWTVGDIGDWPSNGEIDIMEYYRGMILSNFVWGTKKAWVGEWDAAKKPVRELGDGWADNYHIWRMDWDEKRIKLYVDGLMMNEVKLSETVNPTDKFGGPKNPFKSKQFIILNLGVGGDNGGDPSKSEFPAKFIVDYVRVYQKK